MRETIAPTPATRNVFTLFLEFGVCVLCGFAALLVLAWCYWPGLASTDTQLVLEQIIGTREFNAWFPSLPMITMFPFVDQSKREITYLVFQSFIAATACGVGVMVLFECGNWLPRRKAMRLGFMALTSFLLLCAPPSGDMNMVLWKDIPSTWLSFAVVSSASAMSLLWANRDQRDGLPRLALSIVAIFGGVANGFRYNMGTVTHPIFLITILFFWRHAVVAKVPWKKDVLISIAAYLLITISGALLTNQVGGEKKIELAKPGGLQQWVYTVDFFGALSMGIPLSKDEEKQLNSMLSKEKIDKLKNTPYYNSFNYWTFANNSGVDTVEKKQALKSLSVGVLENNPRFWLSVKWRYGMELLDSRNGYQIPPEFSNDACEHALDGRIKLCLNPSRKYWRDMHGDLSGRSNSPRSVLFWSFWPVVIIQIGVLFILLVLIVHSCVVRRIDVLRRWIPLVVSSLACICLFTPMWLISITNDFRYFWPMIPYTQLALLIGMAECGRTRILDGIQCGNRIL